MNITEELITNVKWKIACCSRIDERILTITLFYDVNTRIVVTSELEVRFGWQLNDQLQKEAHFEEAFLTFDNECFGLSEKKVNNMIEDWLNYI